MLGSKPTHYPSGARSGPAVDHRRVAERRVGLGFARLQAVPLIEAAGPEVVGGGPEPQPVRQPLFREIEQGAADPAALRLRQHEELVDAAGVRLQGEEPDEPILVPCQICRPSRRQFASNAIVIAGFGGEARDRQSGRLPARQPQPRRGGAVLIPVATDGDCHPRSQPAGHSPPWATMKSTTRSRPSPVFRLVKTNGRSPRMRLASRSITSRLAPTKGARSILLMTSKSERVMPGPPLRGILSPAATSMT